MDGPNRCQVCGKSRRLDGTPAELEVGNRCGQHSGKGTSPSAAAARIRDRLGDDFADGLKAAL